MAALGLVACLAFASESRAMRFLTVSDIPSTASWGPTTQGLRLSLSLAQTSVRVGDPILATIDLENLGPDHEVSLGCNMDQWHEIGIVDDRGTALPRLPADVLVCGATPSSSLMKHDSVLEVTLRLDDKFRIGEAGSYTVTATSTIHLPSTLSLDSSGNQKYDNPILASLVSNAVKIDIQPHAASDAYEIPKNQPVPLAFQPIITELRAHTRIPILLPINLITAPNTTVGYVVDAASTNYTVQMSMGTECHDGMYCRYGTLHGESSSGSTPPLTGTHLAFERGFSGYFTAFMCGANCNESVLTFDYKGSRYTVGIEAGKLSDVVLLAQSLARF